MKKIALILGIITGFIVGWLLLTPLRAKAEINRSNMNTIYDEVPKDYGYDDVFKATAYETYNTNHWLDDNGIRYVSTNRQSRDKQSHT